MKKFSILKELLSFLVERRKWWLFPIIFILGLFGFIIILGEGTIFAPFIYTLF